jgi:hypothetical protein
MNEKQKELTERIKEAVKAQGGKLVAEFDGQPTYDGVAHILHFQRGEDVVGTAISENGKLTQFRVR